ncbi:MAG: hypothetical protein E6924_00760 [Cutibacterium avidum]|nr:hypothetical protein [Cutibacterium avidum]
MTNPMALRIVTRAMIRLVDEELISSAASLMQVRESSKCVMGHQYLRLRRTGYKAKEWFDGSAWEQVSAVE